MTILSSLQWCRNGHHGISNHWCFSCLLNHLFRYRSNKTSKLHFVTSEFPTQRPVMQKKISFDDIMLEWNSLHMKIWHWYLKRFLGYLQLPLPVLCHSSSEACPRDLSSPKGYTMGMNYWTMRLVWLEMFVIYTSLWHSNWRVEEIIISIVVFVFMTLRFGWNEERKWIWLFDSDRIIDQHFIM